MKKVFHKFLATNLAILLLASTVSWTVDKHLCMGQVIDVSFFADADDCGMELSGPLASKLDNHCCGDESFTLLGQDDLLHDYQGIPFGKQQLIGTLTSHFLLNILPTETENLEKGFHPPPKLVRNLQLQNQVFLI